MLLGCLLPNKLSAQDLAIGISANNTSPIVSTKVDFTVEIRHVSGGVFNNVVANFTLPPCYLWAEIPDRDYDLTTGNINVPIPIGPGQNYIMIFHTIYAPDFFCANAPTNCDEQAAIIATPPVQNTSNDIATVSISAQTVAGIYQGVGFAGPPLPSSAVLPAGNSAYVLQKFHIKGDVTFDGDVIFRDCELYIEPDVELTIQSNVSLTFYNCHVYACTQQWKGMIVQNKGELHAFNTAIEDATRAIYTEEGVLELKGNVFNNNRISIELENTHPIIAFQANHPSVPPVVTPAFVTLHKNLFLGSGSYMLPPFAGNHPFIGISGLYSYLVATQNQCMSMNNGFAFNYSHLDVRDGRYRDIKNYNPNTPNFFDGCCVSSTAYGGNQGCYLWVTSAQNSLADNFTFDCEIGVHVGNVNHHLINNVMYNVNKGILIEFNHDRVGWIKTNHIRASNIGIGLIHCYTNMLNRVERNYVRVAHPNPISQFNYNGGALPLPPMGIGVGIYHLQANMGIGGNPIQNTEIFTNEIDIYNGYTAIHNEGGNRTFIQGNFIQGFMNGNNDNWWGVFNYNANNCLLTCNKINEWSGSTPIGFLNLAALDNVWACNRFYQGARGMYIGGDCGNTDINGTHLANFNTTGYEIDGSLASGAIMVDQFNNGNTFDYLNNTPSNTVPGATCNGPNCLPAAPTFWVNPFAYNGTTMNFNSFPSIPAWNIANTYNPFDDLGGTSQPELCNIPDTTTFDCGDAGGGSSIVTDRLSSLDSLVANDELDPATHILATRYINEYNLYRKLFQDRTLWENNAIMQNFWDSKSESNFPLFAKIDSLIAEKVNISEIRSTCLSYLDSMNLLRTQILEQDSLLLICTDSVEKINLTHSIADLHQKSNEYLNHITHLLATAHENEVNLSMIINLNEEINPDNIIESNQKMVNRIFLATIIQGVNVLNDNQINALEDIIYQCPAEGGHAVYNARALYHIAYPGMVYQDAVTCLPNEGRKANPILFNTVKVYPNPAQDVITFEWKKALEKDCELRIYNAVGNLIINKTITLGTKSHALNVSDMTNGIYFYQTSEGNSGKFSVAK